MLKSLPPSARLCGSRAGAHISGPRAVSIPPRSITSPWPIARSSSVTVALASASSPETKTVVSSPSRWRVDHQRVVHRVQALHDPGVGVGALDRLGERVVVLDEQLRREPRRAVQRVGCRAAPCPRGSPRRQLARMPCGPPRRPRSGRVAGARPSTAGALTTSSAAAAASRRVDSRRGVGRPRGVLLAAGVSAASRVPIVTVVAELGQPPGRRRGRRVRCRAPRSSGLHVEDARTSTALEVKGAEAHPVRIPRTAATRRAITCAGA